MSASSALCGCPSVQRDTASIVRAFPSRIFLLHHGDLIRTSDGVTQAVGDDERLSTGQPTNES